MSNVIPVKTPLSRELVGYMKSGALNVSDAKHYHSVLGSLFYLSTETEPDLYVAASALG